jgi:Na+-driven multidrug efflux pump
MGAVVSIGLSVIMVPLLHWGVKGAALASCFAQLTAAVWVLHHLISSRSGSILQLKVRNMRIDWRLMRAVLGIGMAPFAAQAAASLVLVVFNNRLGHYGGDMAIAAYAAINGVVMVLVMPIMGLSQGVQPIVGFNYGAKDYGRVKKAEFYAIGAATVMTIISFAVAELFPRQLLELFGGDESFLEMGILGLRIFMAMNFIVGAQIIGAQYFQATGRGSTALVLTVTRQFLFLIPLLFILPYFLGLNGIWLSGPVADTLSFIVTMTVFGRDIRKMNRLQAGEKLESIEA